MRIAALLQLTLPGAPCLYYGDEVGLAGGNDPDCRGAFPWDESRWDGPLHAYVRDLVGLRRAEPALRAGSTTVVAAEGGAVAIDRRLGDARLVVAVNASDEPARLEVGLEGAGDRARLEPVFSTAADGADGPSPEVDGSATRARRTKRFRATSRLSATLYCRLRWPTTRSSWTPLWRDGFSAPSMSRPRSRAPSRPSGRSPAGTCTCVDGQPGGIRAAQLEALGARVVVGGPIDGTPAAEVDDASMDVVVGCWTSFRGVVPTEMAEVARILRPGGRLLAVHDYGRDDVSRLHGDRPEYGAVEPPRRAVPAGGFKIRVIHCFWTFESIEDGQGFLADAFGAPGEAVGAAMTRPRLSYNVAVYHRSFGDGAAPRATPAG